MVGQTAIVIPGEFWWLMCANDGASFVKVLVVPSCIAIHCVRGARYPQHVVGISRLFHLQELSWKVLLIPPPHSR